MPNHRAEPPRRRAAPGRRRAHQARPRYGRLAVLGASVSVTGIAMLGGVGVLPSVAEGSSGTGDRRDAALGDAVDQVLAGAATSPSADPSTETGTGPETSTGAAVAEVESEVPAEPLVPPVPAESGEGRRIVFDEGDQRVWLVRDDGTVARTYLVSGSIYDNLDPGTYSVYSRSAHATGIEQSGTMRYFVRFTEGDAGGAIGFHDIPLSGGEPVQSTDQLGTPQSHGCIRQARKDAIALWGFAPIGTEVVVTA